MHTKHIVTAGREPEDAGKALILLHGRGASPDDILGLASYLSVEDFALLAPQATQSSWYPYSFLAPPAHNEPWLSSALEVLADLVGDINKAGIADHNIFFAGFSQGACLALEFAARHARRWGGVAAFTGGLIGDVIYRERYQGDFAGTPVFIGSGDPDPHVPPVRVRETGAILTEINATVTQKIYPNMGHTIVEEEIDAANRSVFDR